MYSDCGDTSVCFSRNSSLVMKSHLEYVSLLADLCCTHQKEHCLGQASCVWTEDLVVASKEIGLEVNADKTKCTFMSRDQNAGRSHNINIDNSSFESAEQFKYLGTVLTHQNSIREEIKSRLKSGNACYHSAQNLLSWLLCYTGMKLSRSHWGGNVGWRRLRTGCWGEYLGLGGTR